MLKLEKIFLCDLIKLYLDRENKPIEVNCSSNAIFRVIDCPLVSIIQIEQTDYKIHPRGPNTCIILQQ